MKIISAIKKVYILMTIYVLMLFFVTNNSFEIIMTSLILLWLMYFLTVFSYRMKTAKSIKVKSEINGNKISKKISNKRMFILAVITV